MPTSYEIYQTYLRGPAAVIRLFEQALGTQASYGLPAPDIQQCTIDSLSEEIAKRDDQLARLQQELSELRGENHRLRRRNLELEALSAKILIPPRARLLPILHGRSARRVSGAPRASCGAVSPVTPATRCA